MSEEYYHIDETDRRLLNRCRYQRLLSAIPYLAQLLIQWEEDSLEIHCYKPIELNTLLEPVLKKVLVQQVYTLLGVHCLSVCNRDISVWTVRLPANEIESMEDGFSEEFAMSTATLPSVEATTTQKHSEPSPGGILPGQNLKDIAADLGRSVAEVRKWCKTQGMMLIPYGDAEILSGEAAQATYTHFLSEIQQAMVKRGLMVMPSQQPEPMSESNGSNSGNAEATKTPAAKPARTTQRSTARSTAKAPAKRTAAKKKPATQKTTKPA